MLDMYQLRVGSLPPKITLTALPEQVIRVSAAKSPRDFDLGVLHTFAESVDFTANMITGSLQFRERLPDDVAEVLLVDNDYLLFVEYLPVPEFTTNHLFALAGSELHRHRVLPQGTGRALLRQAQAQALLLLRVRDCLLSDPNSAEDPEKPEYQILSDIQKLAEPNVRP